MAKCLLQQIDQNEYFVNGNWIVRTHHLIPSPTRTPKSKSRKFCISSIDRRTQPFHLAHIPFKKHFDWMHNSFSRRCTTDTTFWSAISMLSAIYNRFIPHRFIYMHSTISLHVSAFVCYLVRIPCIGFKIFNIISLYSRRLMRTIRFKWNSIFENSAHARASIRRSDIDAPARARYYLVFSFVHFTLIRPP